MGCAALGAAPAGAARSPAAPVRCQGVATPPPETFGATAPGDLLPADPVSLRICRYVSTSEKLRLRGRYVTSRHARIAALVKQLDGLPAIAAGSVTACPAANGSEVLLLARYRGGRSRRVSVTLSGCPIARRGAIVRSALTGDGPALLAKLERLTS